MYAEQRSWKVREVTEHSINNPPLSIHLREDQERTMRSIANGGAVQAR